MAAPGTNPRFRYTWTASVVRSREWLGQDHGAALAVGRTLVNLLFDPSLDSVVADGVPVFLARWVLGERNAPGTPLFSPGTLLPDADARAKVKQRLEGVSGDEAKRVVQWLRDS